MLKEVGTLGNAPPNPTSRGGGGGGDEAAIANKTLRSLRFEVGDYLDVAIFDVMQGGGGGGGGGGGEMRGGHGGGGGNRGGRR